MITCARSPDRTGATHRSTDLGERRSAQCAVGASSVVAKSATPADQDVPWLTGPRCRLRQGDPGAMPDIHREPARSPMIPNFLPTGASVTFTRVVTRGPADLGDRCSSRSGSSSRSSGSRQPKRSAEPATWAADDRRRDGRVGDARARLRRVPHEWLTFANSYLNFGKATFLVRENQSSADRSAVRHHRATCSPTSVAAGIYGVVFGTINV